LLAARGGAGPFEKGSVFVIDAIIDRILKGPAPPRAASKQD